MENVNQNQSANKEMSMIICKDGYIYVYENDYKVFISNDDISEIADECSNVVEAKGMNVEAIEAMFSTLSPMAYYNAFAFKLMDKRVDITPYSFALTAELLSKLDVIRDNMQVDSTRQGDMRRIANLILIMASNDETIAVPSSLTLMKE
jgi:hypothetical protein